MTENLTMAQIMHNMPKVFKADRAAGVDADIQFRFTGEEPGSYVLSVRNGEASIKDGEIDNPAATIDAPSEVWKGVALGQTNAMTAFMTGKFKATGDMGLLMRLPTMFG